MKNKNKIIVLSVLAPILFFTSYIYSFNYNKIFNSQELKAVKIMSYSNPHRIYVNVGGEPIGIKLNTDGVLVVGLSDIITNVGKENSPAALSGVQIGDIITKINDEKISSSKDMSVLINKHNAEKIKVTINRNGEEVIKDVLPVKSADDENYKLGIWIRDRAAGVGTLTYYDNKTGKFAALGHPITDVDTGTLLKVKKGNIVDSTIISIKKGLAGYPGEVRGIFVDEDTSIGSIEKNTICGIYGSNFSGKKNLLKKELPVAFRHEIKLGKAQILTTINGEKPQLYDINIEKLLEQNSPGPKSMIIKVTDPVLLQKTGGIVQGMSGSPIIQNNKIVGAVTHVLINRPDVGYGIYIEWMLKDSGLM